MNIGISGHQRIPEPALHYVTHGIESVLAKYRDDLRGFTSLAAGADQIFGASVLKLGGSLTVIIPCHDYENTFQTPAELHEFLRLTQRAASTEILDLPCSQLAYLEAGRRIARASDLLIAVWDGLPARGSGGTADIVAYARTIAVPVEIVWPVGVSR